MSFPETYGGDPIVINEHCGIFFVPQSRGFFAAVACSTSLRRIKVRVDLSKSTRYYVFSPMVGTVVVGPMIVEATITPYRVRNIGLVGPDKGSPPPSYAVMLSRLIYTVLVYVENDKGVMIPANKWKKSDKSHLLNSTLLTLSPTTMPNAWPSWLGNLRSHDFVMMKRNVILEPQHGESEEDKVLLHVDIVADGEACLVSAVNKGHTPHRVVYRALCGARGVEDNAANPTVSPDAKSSTFLENATMPIFFVPMDGHECKGEMSLEGYVPGGGDVALGWVVKATNDAPVVFHNVLSHAFAATACSPVLAELISPQREAESSAAAAAVFSGRRKSVSTRRSGVNSTAGRSVSNVMRKPNSLAARPAASKSLSSMRSTSSVPVNRPLCSLGSTASLCESPEVQNRTSVGMIKAMVRYSPDIFAQEPSPEKPPFVPQSVPSVIISTEGWTHMGTDNERVLRVGEWPTDQFGEEGLISFERGVVNVDEAPFSGKCDNDVSSLQDYSVREKQGKINATQSAFVGRTEEKNEGRMVTLEAVQCHPEKGMMEAVEGSFAATACMKKGLELDVEETLKRISIRTEEMTEWKAFRMEYQQPLCLICRKPVSVLTQYMEETPNEDKFHFLCYMEMKRQQPHR